MFLIFLGLNMSCIRRHVRPTGTVLLFRVYVYKHFYSSRVFNSLRRFEKNYEGFFYIYVINQASCLCIPRLPAGSNRLSRCLWHCNVICVDKTFPSRWLSSRHFPLFKCKKTSQLYQLRVRVKVRVGVRNRVLASCFTFKW